MTFKYDLTTFDHGEFRIFTFQVKKEHYIPLVPLARACGLNEAYFRTLLRKHEDIAKHVELFVFTAAEVQRLNAPWQNNTAHSKISGQSIKCIPARKLEVLLNRVDTRYVKNKAAAAKIKELQVAVNGLIEAYYHDGGVVNPKATPTQIQDLMRKQIELLQKNQAISLEAIGLLQTQVSSLASAFQKQSDRVDLWRGRALSVKDKFKATKRELLVVNGRLAEMEQDAANRVELGTEQSVELRRFKKLYRKYKTKYHDVDSEAAQLAEERDELKDQIVQAVSEVESIFQAVREHVSAGLPMSTLLRNLAEQVFGGSANLERFLADLERAKRLQEGTVVDAE